MDYNPMKRITLPAAIVISLIICTAAFLVARLMTPSTSTAISGIVTLPCRPDQTIKPLGDGVIYSDGAFIYALDGDGRQRWSHASGTGSDFSVSDGGVATWRGNRLTLLDAVQGTTYNAFPTDGTILSAKLGLAYVAVQTSTENDLLSAENNSSILVYGRNGSLSEKYDFPEKTIIDYGFFNNGTLFWVMSIDTEGTVPLSSITTYRPGRSTMGRIAPTDQRIYRVFFESNRIRAVGLTHLVTYEYTGTRQADAPILVYGWNLMDVGETQPPMAVFAPEAQTNANIVSISDVRMISETDDRIIRMPFPCFSLAVQGSTAYGFNRQSVVVCGLHDEKPVAYPLPVEVDKFIGMTNQNAAILSSGSVVYLVYLPS